MFSVASLSDRCGEQPGSPPLILDPFASSPLSTVRGSTSVGCSKHPQISFGVGDSITTVGRDNRLSNCDGDGCARPRLFPPTLSGHTNEDGEPRINNGAMTTEQRMPREIVLSQQVRTPDAEKVQSKSQELRTPAAEGVDSAGESHIKRPRHDERAEGSTPCSNSSEVSSDPSQSVPGEIPVEHCSSSRQTSLLPMPSKSESEPAWKGRDESSTERSSGRLRRIERQDYAKLHKVGMTASTDEHGYFVVEFALANLAASGYDRTAIQSAILTEVLQLESYGVFAPVDARSLSVEALKAAIPTVMLVTEKTAPDGTFIKLKARLVVKGYLDKGDDNHGKTESPTVSQEVVMLVLNVAVSLDYNIDVFDVRAAFLEAELERQNVLVLIDKDLANLLVTRDPRMEAGRLESGDMVVRLRRALYGLKEAPRRWYETLTAFLHDMGFSRSRFDDCLFIRECKEGMHYVLVHVDDMLSTGPKSSMEEFRNGLKKRFKEVTETLNQDRFNYLGMTVRRLRQQGVIELSQIKYIESVKAKLQLGESDLASTPWNGSLFDVDDAALPLEPLVAATFASTLMLMLYVTKTRPDIRCGIIALTTRMQHPTLKDFAVLIQLGKYLNATKNLSLRITASDMVLFGAADASFGVHVDKKSHTGLLLWLGNNNAPIMTSSKKQSLVTRSSAEAELVALDALVYEVTWMRLLLEEMGFKQNGPTTLHQDNEACKKLAEDGKPGQRSRSVEIKYFWVRQQIERGLVKLVSVRTDKMLADGFTKPLTGSDFHRWRDLILNLVNNRVDSGGCLRHALGIFPLSPQTREV